jgi:hypothetical protein
MFEPMQRQVCEALGAPCLPVDVGAALAVGHAEAATPLVLRGLRLRPAGGASGWYVWAEASGAVEPESLAPLRPTDAAEVAARYPQVTRFLGLPPGWRFELRAGREHVWFDRRLLEGD